jgi:hypothetical protein
MDWEKIKHRTEAYILKAPSLDALARFGAEQSDQADSDRAAFGDDSSRSMEAEPDWDLSAGYQQAVKYGTSRAIWRDGTEALKAAAASASAIIRDLTPALKPTADVVGGRVSVPHFVRNDPRCFVRNKTGAALARPGVTLMLCTNAPGGVKAEALTNLTASAAALAAVLAKRGYRVRAFSGSVNSGLKPYTAQVTPLFSPDKPFNAARCAFQACHGAAPRRLGFAATERGGKRLHKLTNTYGATTRTSESAGVLEKGIKQATGARNLVVLPYDLAGKYGNGGVYEELEEMTLVDVVKYVIEQARAQGIEI